ncbi:hypothetical protein [Aquabacterium sp. OR-4]|uniref:hypothetical protein n=1 Tax=Aquabacterium sp. OR-4 TaxID=2978127 RepID=UPI0021B3AD66|nr:hypothetical protein [Aquabacterium sp. OR-4]MDT7838258.1 hypothetical protein [Aquabacterium sp. OR-4]
MSDTAPERWAIDAGDAGEALLDIPPDAHRDRRFEVAVALTVRCPAELHGAWHELQILANGHQQWRRRIDSSNPGQTDGLDYRFARTVPLGEPLRVLAKVAVRGVGRERVVIEAEEL